MTERDKKDKAEDFSISNTIDDIKKLQKKVYTACDDLDEHAEVIGESMYNAMLEHYTNQYLREFEIANASAMLDVDKQVEELKIKRIKELAEIAERKLKLENELDELRAQQSREFELEKDKTIKEFEILRTKELGEIELEHERVKADIARRRQELEADAEVLTDTVEQELSAKMEKIIPGFKHRRRIFGIPIGKIRYNQAMELAMVSAELSSYEYLRSRAQKINERKEKMGLLDDDPDEMTDEVLAAPISKKDRKALLRQCKQLSKAESLGTIISEMQKTLEELENPTKQEFTPEPMTERDKQYYLQEFEREEIEEIKERRRAGKAERRQRRKALKRLKKSSKKEAVPPADKPESEKTTKIDIQVQASENDAQFYKEDEE